MKLNNSIFGMIHLAGSDPVETALKEIKIYEECGLKGAIVENYHGSTDDVIEVLKNLSTTLDIGINILPNEYDQAFKIADTYGANFIQLDYISGKYYKNTYLDVQHYLSIRNKYPDIFVMGGVWPKYYRPLENSILEDDLLEAKLYCDAIVVTGQGTGQKTPTEKVLNFKEIIGDFPLIIGAGMDTSNINLLEISSGAIVGSSFKPNGTTSIVDKDLVLNFMKSVCGK